MTAIKSKHLAITGDKNPCIHIRSVDFSPPTSRNTLSHGVSKSLRRVVDGLSLSLWVYVRGEGGWWCLWWLELRLRRLDIVKGNRERVVFCFPGRSILGRKRRRRKRWRIPRAVLDSNSWIGDWILFFLSLFNLFLVQGRKESILETIIMEGRLFRKVSSVAITTLVTIIHLHPNLSFFDSRRDLILTRNQSWFLRVHLLARTILLKFDFRVQWWWSRQSVKKM